MVGIFSCLSLPLAHLEGGFVTTTYEKNAGQFIAPVHKQR